MWKDLLWKESLHSSRVFRNRLSSRRSSPFTTRHCTMVFLLTREAELRNSKITCVLIIGVSELFIVHSVVLCHSHSTVTVHSGGLGGSGDSPERYECSRDLTYNWSISSVNLDLVPLFVPTPMVRFLLSPGVLLRVANCQWGRFR